MKLLALLLTVVCLNVQAAPELIGLHLGSVHRHEGMNNFNPGVYARWENGFTAGTYRNSMNRQTVYAGWTWHDEDDRFAVTLGGATGYSRKVEPIIVPSVRVGLTDTMSMRLALAACKNNPAIHLSIERRF